MNNPDLKVCKKCKKQKSTLTDFYMCQGKCRSECKPCTIKKNVKYQKLTKAWMNRFVDSDKSRSYMLDYYSKNKEKFKEYRRKFKEKHPEYHKEYARMYKDKKNGRKSKHSLPSTHPQKGKPYG